MKLINQSSFLQDEYKEDSMDGLIAAIEHTFGGYGSGTTMDLQYDQMNTIPYEIEREMGMVPVLIPT